MKKIFAFACSFLVLFAVSFSLNSCKKNASTTTVDHVAKTGIPMDALQEGAGIASSASGTVDIDYTKSSKMLMYTIRWSGLTNNASAMHFHGPALRGASASPVIPVTGFTAGSAGTYSGMATLTADQEADMLAGKWYFNIHTSTYPGGEIRGQIEF